LPRAAGVFVRASKSLKRKLGTSPIRIYLGQATLDYPELAAGPTIHE